MGNKHKKQRKLRAPVENKKSPTAVIWDIENAKPPHGMDAGEVGKKLKEKLFEEGFEGPITIYAVAALETSLPEKTVEKLKACKDVDLSFVGYVGKDAADTKLVSKIDLWVEQNPAPANLVFISGDNAGFSEALVRVKKEGYHTLLLLNKQAKIIANASVAAATCYFRKFLGLKG